MKLRVTYLTEKELEDFKSGLQIVYDVLSESSSYPTRNSKYRRKYFEISIKEEKLEYIKNIINIEAEIV